MGPNASKGGKEVDDFRWPIKKSIKGSFIQASRSYLNFFQISEMSPFLAPANTVHHTSLYLPMYLVYTKDRKNCATIYFCEQRRKNGNFLVTSFCQF